MNFPMAKDDKSDQEIRDGEHIPAGIRWLVWADDR